MRLLIILLVVVALSILLLSFYYMCLQHSTTEQTYLISGQVDGYKISSNQVSFILRNFNTTAEEIKNPIFTVSTIELNGDRILPSLYSSQFEFVYEDTNSDGILNNGDSIIFTFKEEVEITTLGVSLQLAGPGVYWGNIPGGYP